MNYYGVLSRARVEKRPLRSARVFSESKEVHTYIPKSLLSLRIVIKFLELKGCELSSEELSEELGVDTKYLEHVVKWLVNINVLEVMDNKYRLSPIGKLLVNKLIKLLS